MPAVIRFMYFYFKARNICLNFDRVTVIEPQITYTLNSKIREDVKLKIASGISGERRITATLYQALILVLDIIRILFRLWLLILALVTRVTGEYSECALLLSTTARHRGRSLCIRYQDVEEAFHKARHLVGLMTPARETTDISIAILGSAIQETTRILKQRFWLTPEEVEQELAQIDTLRTDIARFCPPHLLSVPCVPEKYRRIDATCNNLKHSYRGAAKIPFSRLIPPVYGDGIAEPRRSQGQGGLPNPRTVSRMVHADIGSRHSHAVSLLFPAWGQLLDHDLTLTAETKEPHSRKDVDCCIVGPGRHPNCLPIPIPRDDPFYSPNRQTCMNFARSLAGLRPNCSLGSRVQQNSVTSYIDGNFIYGSGERIARALRTYKSGYLLTGHPPAPGLKPLLPMKTLQPDDGCLRPNFDAFCFLAGDNRVNEQIALGVLHTLAVREHNNIATKLANINPLWNDEKLYQETRHIMAGIIQHITYSEFLPALLGDKFMKMYNLTVTKDGYSYEYDEEVDAGVPSSFATAAFRFGHSLLPRTVQRRSPTHRIIGERRLSEMLQQPYELYTPGTIDQYVLGMASQLSQAMDSSLTLEVTNHLFQIEGSDFGRDLAAINVARAREHGVPGFVSFRRACGLPDMHTWSDMLKDIPNDTVSNYLNLYSGAEDVDLWSAGVSEARAEGSLVGPVFSCIIALTFRKLKKGDRYWYENPSTFTKEQLREIKKYKLSRMICNAGDSIYTIQPNVLLLPDYQLNPRVSCRSKEIPDLDLSHWKDWKYYEDTTPPYKKPPSTVSSNNIFSEESYLNHEKEEEPEDEEKNKIISFSQLITDLISDKRNKTLHLTDKHGFYSDGHSKAVTLQ